MINHARTLLLNIAHGRAQLQDRGYEYIPENYTPVQLNTTLSTLRRVVFGSNPDNYFLNVRARELLGYIHETELAQYVYALDPRVTYWPPTAANFFENAKTRVNITQVSGQPLRLNFGGTFSANNATGTSTQTYDVVLNSVEDILAVSTQQTTKPGDPVTTVINATGNPPTLPLAETNLQFSVNFATTASTTELLTTELAELIITEQYNGINNLEWLIVEPQADTTLGFTTRPVLQTAFPPETVVARWQITVQKNPAPIIANIGALELLGETLFLDLFGLKRTEPYVTFKNLWFDHPLPAYRLSGLILAAIYRTNELMRGKNG